MTENLKFDEASFPLEAGTNNAIYHVAIKLKGFSYPQTIFSAAANSGKILRALGKWTPDENRELAIKHTISAFKFSRLYSEKLDEASMATFGRKFEVKDYQISCIGREEFSEEYKKQLRFLNDAARNHSDIAYAHITATRYSRSKMIEEAKEIFNSNNSKRKVSP